MCFGFLVLVPGVEIMLTPGWALVSGPGPGVPSLELVQRLFELLIDPI